MAIRGEIFSSQVQTEKRTYFFNVKENRMGSHFLNIVESTKKPDGTFDRHSIMVYEEDIENFSFNTTISAFMIAVNDLTSLGCSKRAVLEPLVVLLSPFAPHIAEELWERLGHSESVAYASFPEFVAAYAAEDVITYPVQFNGKMRFTLDLPKSATPAEVEAAVRSAELTPKYVGAQSIVKVIVVPGRIVNVVVK